MSYLPSGQSFSLANLPAPMLIGPSGTIMASAGYDTPTFGWSAVSSADHYWLYVVDLKTGKVAIDRRTLTGVSYTTSLAEALKPGHSYVWYLASVSSNG